MRFPKPVEYLIFSDICEVRKKSRIEGDLPLIELDCISQNIGELIRIYNSNDSLSEKNYFERGDVLFGKLRPYLNKHFLPNFSGMCSSEIWPLIPKKVSSEFLYCFIQSKYFLLEANISSGTKMPRADWKYLSTINVPIFTQENMNRISKIIIKMEQRIITQKKIIEDLIILKNNIINSIYETPKYNCKFDNCITQVSNRNKNAKINEILSVNNKLGFIKQSEQFEEREVASDDVTNYKIIEKNMFAYNPARINVGSIAKYNPNTPGIVSPMYICFKTNNNIDANYLNYYFNSNEFKKQMRKRLEGSVRLCLTYESMINIPFYLPSFDIQKKNAALLTAFINKIDFEKKYLNLLESQKVYLLNKMFI